MASTSNNTAKIKETPRSRIYCCVSGCMNSSNRNKDLAFFHIPHERERRIEWLKLISREDLTSSTSSYRLCEQHFRPSDIIRTFQRRRRKKNAMPCLKLPIIIRADKGTETEDLKTYNVSCQTEINISEIDYTYAGTSEMNSLNLLSENNPVKIEIKTEFPEESKQIKVQRLESKNLEEDTFFSLCDRFLSKEFSDVVKSQSNLLLLPNINKNTLEYKIFCLNLYYVNPVAYNLFQKSVNLPCHKTLQNISIPISTKVYDDQMAVLKLKVNNMSEKEKHCSLLVDLMNINANFYYDIQKDKIIGFHEVDGVITFAPAKYALVLMVRGIFENWSQPIGFAFLSKCQIDDNITNWIDKILIKLFDIGLYVRTFVSDLGADFLKTANKRGVSVEKTYFTVNNHKIYYIFDAPHLLKSVRNNFMKYDFQLDNKRVAKFEYIFEYFEYAKCTNGEQANKLTKYHLEPKKYEKTNVRLAAQLLSRSVASGISTYIKCGLMRKSAKYTVEFIKVFNDLFDALNSSSLHHSNLQKKAFCGDKHQIDFFNNIITFLQNLKTVDSLDMVTLSKRAKFIDGFIITIKSILHLYVDFHTEGHKYIFTRRLNLDVMQNFFRKIRSFSRKKGNPSSRKFVSYFRKLYFADVTKAPKGNNLKNNLTDFFQHLKDFDSFCRQSAAMPVKSTTQDNLLDIKRDDYITFHMPEKTAYLHICGALFQKCIERHDNCELFVTYMKEQQKRNLHRKFYLTGNILLDVPPDDFVKSIKTLEQVFQQVFTMEYFNNNIGLHLYKQLKDLTIVLPCPCFPKVYLLKLYIRMKIYFILVKNNKEFKRCSDNELKIFNSDL